MSKYNISDFMKLKKGEVIQLNKSNCFEYKSMVKNINCTPIREYNYVKGMFVDTLFVGVVRSIEKGKSKSFKLFARITLQDCTGELRIALMDDDVYNLFRLDLDVPIGIVLRLTNNPKCMSPAPGYRFVKAIPLFK